MPDAPPGKLKSLKQLKVYASRLGKNDAPRDVTTGRLGERLPKSFFSNHLENHPLRGRNKHVLARHLPR